MENYYITTTLPYVNAEPHIGFALEIIQADSIARMKRLEGYSVCFNFGTDEHGLKIYRKAVEAGIDPQKYCDEYAKKFDDLKKALNLSYTNFVRTTDPHHIMAAQEFWKRCDRAGDIYKKNYRIKYCVGCELEKSDSELENNRCPIHPNQELEIIEEENYFFRFSRYQKKLLELYGKNQRFVIPTSKLNEIKNFVGKGLEDFSISRLKNKMPWGIPVPGDPEHVMYVWFDALINYISTVGWPDDMEEFGKWWPVVQVAGKDNLRQQSAIWQAMLFSAGIPNSKQIFIHGFITSEGQKISKSLGNTVNPFSLVEKYGTDALRYYLLREIPPWGDGDFSEGRFKEVYNADLANNLGNLVQRISRLASNAKFSNTDVKRNFDIRKYPELIGFMDEFRFNDALAFIWEKVTATNKLIDDREPWKLSGKELEQFLSAAILRIAEIAYLLQPFLPETSSRIRAIFSKKRITVESPLFPRLK